MERCVRLRLQRSRQFRYERCVCILCKTKTCKTFNTVPVTSDLIVCLSLLGYYEFRFADLYTVKKEDLAFKTPFRLQAHGEYCLNAMAVYFTIEFTKTHSSIGFSTASDYPKTHWLQTVFFLRNSPTMKMNDELSVRWEYVLDVSQQTQYSTHGLCHWHQFQKRYQWCDRIQWISSGYLVK